jgi:hypothetical protein
MGIDIHALNFLRYVSKKKALGRVATIGRQSLMVPRAYVEFGGFCEQLLIKRFDAMFVDSYDYSDFEGATYVLDMNKPVVSEKEYDTLIDCGCIEHIYNVPQALTNISLLCARGGQIVHVLPANNFCGHGFWQFSPELFFSLYSERNGYSETEVFLADLTKENDWFEVKQPNDGQRANVASSSPLYVLCRTRKLSDFSHENVQQSDYVYAWEHSAEVTRQPSRLVGAAKKLMRSNPLLYRSSLSVYERTKAALGGIRNPTTLSNINHHLRKRDVSELLAS